MQVQCVHCGRQYSLRDESAGSQFACRSCGKISPVAQAAAHPTQAAPAPSAAEPTLVAVACRHCGRQYRVKETVVGMQFKCKKCGQLSPADPMAASPEAASPAPPQCSSGAEVGRLRVGQPGRRRLAPQQRPGPQSRRRRKWPCQSIPRRRLFRTYWGCSTKRARRPPALHSASRRPRSRPLSPTLSGSARKKSSKRRSAAETNVLVVLRILGGLAIMAAGVGISVFGLYALQDDSHGTRRPIRAIFAGVCIIGTGFKVAIGKLKSD